MKINLVNDSGSPFKAYVLIALSSSACLSFANRLTQTPFTVYSADFSAVTIVLSTEPLILKRLLSCTLLSSPSVWPDAVCSHVVVFWVLKALDTKLAALTSLEYSSLLLSSFRTCRAACQADFPSVATSTVFYKMVCVGWNVAEGSEILKNIPVPLPRRHNAHIMHTKSF